MHEEIDRYNRNSEIDPERYCPYEVSRFYRQHLRTIKEQLAHLGGHQHHAPADCEKKIRANIDFLEQLEKEVRTALQNEKKIGYHNDTLMHDYEKIKALLNRYKQELRKCDPLVI